MRQSGELQACRVAAVLRNCRSINAFLKSNLLEFVLLGLPLVSIVTFVAQIKKRPTLAQSVITTKAKRKLEQHLKICGKGNTDFPRT